MWIKAKDRHPKDNKRYPVIIECDGELKDGYTSYITKRNKFHFDMNHINWHVVAWFDLPEYKGD